MSKKKKIVILSCMIALLAVTAVFNFILTTGTVNPDDTVVNSSANYFSQYRNERITTRNEELLQLDAVTVDPDQKEMFLIEWECDGKTGRNHFVNNIRGINFDTYMDFLNKTNIGHFEGFQYGKII